MTQLQNPFDAAHANKCELATAVLRASGRLRLRVNGWSMLPTMMPGDVLMIERVGGDSICMGDIVLFHRDRRLFVHRLVSSSEDGRIVTRGDAMPRPDSPPVAASELLGKVSLIVRSGHCVEPRTKLGIIRRIMAEIMRRSNSAARIFVRVQGMRRNFKELALACHS